MRCLPALFVAIVSSMALQADAQVHRYWYDRTCQMRIDATVTGVNDDNAILETSDGKCFTVPFSRLSQADEVYLTAYQLSLEAAEHIAASPYETAEQELNDLRDRLMDNRVSDEHANSVTRLSRLAGDRKVTDLEGRWIEIRGIRYRVVTVVPSSSVTGIASLVVEVEDGHEAIVPQYRIDEIRILPQINWSFSRWKAGDQPFHRRGPPSRSMYSPQDRWKYTLVFDPVHFVWTDSESAKAHAILERVAQLWRVSGSLSLIADARWNLHRGNEAFAKSELDTALRHYTLAIEKAPVLSEAHLRRGLVYEQLHRRREALVDLDNAIELEGAHLREGFDRQFVLLPAYAARARIRSVEKMHDAAIADAQHALKLNTGDADLTYKHLLNSVRTTAADDQATFAKIVVDEYERGIDVDERRFDAAIAAATSAVGYNPDASDTTFGKLLDRCRKLSAEHLGKLAASAFQLRNYEAAIAYAEKAVDRCPEPKYHNVLLTYRKEQHEFLVERTRDYAKQATDALASDEFDRAVRNAERARQLAPSDLQGDMSQLLARCLMKRAVNKYYVSGDFAEAESDLTRYIALVPGDATGYAMRGSARAHLSRTRDALADLNEGIKRDPNAELAFFVRGTIYNREGRPNDAVSDLNMAIGINAKESVYWYVRGEAHLTLGNIDQAFSDASKAIELDGRVSSYYLLRAEALHAKRHFPQALEDVEYAIRLDPTSSRAMSIRRHIERRRRYEDPHYVDEDRLMEAGAKVVLAWFGGEFAREGARKFDEREGFWAKLRAGIQIGIGLKGKDIAIDSAIDDVFPNLPDGEKRLLKPIISQLLDGQLNLESLLGDVSRDGIKDWVKEEYPGLGAVSAEVGTFLYEIHREIKQYRSDKQALIERSVNPIAILRSDAIDVRTLSLAP